VTGPVRHLAPVPAPTVPRAGGSARRRWVGPRRGAGTTTILVTAFLLSGCVVAPVSVERPAPPGSILVAPQPAGGPPGATPPPATMQYLYGSAESAAISIGAYQAMVDAVRATIARGDRASALVFPAGREATPTPQPCAAGTPPAVVFDADETVLLNLGYEFNDALTGAAYDPVRWRRWEETGADKVAAVPGAVAAVSALRAMGVAVIVNSNRAAATARGTEAALAAAGLGRFRAGETLFLKGEGPAASVKDARRRQIGARWCVLAMAGDQIGDFTDIPAAYTPGGRRAAASAAPFASYWGRRWFMLPNPVYGTGLGAGWTETFPADKRWSDAP